ncbi:MAG: hypothetical protein MJ229_00955 [bacterium]|nr:hypothetical protein [bacterium]
MRINPVDAYSIFEIANKNNNKNNTKNNYYPTPSTFTFEGDTVSFSQTEKKPENKLTKILKNIFTPNQLDVSYYDPIYRY